MTIKLIHSHILLHDPDAHVVRLRFPTRDEIGTASTYRKITQQAYKLIKGTWGYSTLRFNMSSQSIDGYIYFADSTDALQFRLSIDVNAIRVIMWSRNILFTIHEYRN